ncbi:MAG: sigma-70 family RNA polymerase sigma factor [Clostridia bacterium]|nr:sigma-70 family RNA polymerase sigma factor [Clostridia bacterium]
MATENEKILIEKSKQGDVDAFEQLIISYQKKIVNLAYRMLGNMADAEDAAQDIFVRVFRSISGFNEQAAFSTWIYRIATNVCLDILRKKKRQNEQNTISIHRGEENDEYELPIEDNQPSPYEQAQKSAAMKALEKALNQLGDEQKMVIILRDINGLSYEEIAEITNCTLGTVKSRINRSRLTLRKLLENDKELFL